MLIIWLVTLTLFIIGFAGLFVPGLPGVGLIFAGILTYGIATSFETISMLTIIILAFVTAIAWAADYLGSALGAKVGGGSWVSSLLAIGGTIVGLVIFGPIGLVLGALTGSLLGAMIEGKDSKQASKMAIYSLIGALGATVVQLILATTMLITFFIAIS